MKKLGITLLAAIVGGVIAVGAFKLFENKQMDNMTLEERQNVYYANNPSGEITASTGNPDFTEAAAAVSPGVVHIQVTMSGRNSRGNRGGSPFDLFEEFFGVPQQRRGPARPATASG